MKHMNTIITPHQDLDLEIQDIRKNLDQIYEHVLQIKQDILSRDPHAFDKLRYNRASLRNIPVK